MIDLVALQKALDTFYRKIRWQSPVADGAQHLAPQLMTGDERLQIEAVAEAVRVVVTADPQWKCAARGFRANPCDKRHGWEKEDNPKCGWVVVVPVRSSE